MKYEYHINLDERGEFNADVREINTDSSVFEIGDHVNPLADMIDMGFMSSKDDISGLEEYLKGVGILEDDDSLISPY